MSGVGYKSGLEDLDGGGVMSAVKIGYEGDWTTSFARQLSPKIVKLAPSKQVKKAYLSEQ